MHVPSVSHFATWFCTLTEGNHDSFELPGGVFFETSEIMTKMLLLQQGASKNIPVRAVFM